MVVRIRNVEKTDTSKFAAWYANINGEQYLSHAVPNSFVSANGLPMLWFIILNDEKEIGCAWLEQKNVSIKELNLGIYLNDPKIFGMGLGKEAIKEILKQNTNFRKEYQIVLNVRKSNVRAIKCYQKCGFEIVEEKEKEINGKRILIYKMRHSDERDDEVIIRRSIWPHKKGI